MSGHGQRILEANSDSEHRLCDYVLPRSKAAYIRSFLFLFLPISIVDYEAVLKNTIYHTTLPSRSGCSPFPVRMCIFSSV
jgi:hypothetical protein